MIKKDKKEGVILTLPYYHCSLVASAIKMKEGKRSPIWRETCLEISQEFGEKKDDCK